MTRQNVLIVDDSKTAQVRLRKMLKRFNVEVDTSLSAEEALGYLSHKIPDVIFLDHHMQGMDGLEALRIIKSNPNTATIPVIMYTSEKGDVYIGRARALGALDILSKEIIKPGNLDRVLNRLNIEPLQGETSQSTEAGSPKLASSRPGDNQKIVVLPEKPTATEKKVNEAGLKQVEAQLARLFELHITGVRQQITDHTKFIVKRLGSEIRNTETIRNTKAEQTKEQEQIPKVYSIERSGREFDISNIILFVLVTGMFFLGYELIQARNKVTEVANSYAEMVKVNQAKNVLITNLEKQGAFSNSAESDSKQTINNSASADALGKTQTLRSLDWAFETQFQFDFKQPPLGEIQTKQINNLIYLLDSIGFKGDVSLEIHFGNPCLAVTSNGEWQLANSDLPVGQCIMYKDVSPDLSPNAFLSASYLALKQTTAPIAKGRINIDVATRGFELPSHQYPENLSSTKAGEWNQIALQNNRVSVLLKGR